MRDSPIGYATAYLFKGFWQDSRSGEEILQEMVNIISYAVLCFGA
ncbi:MAG: hypothetical protein PHD43_15925 [Methylococcales bacterium]|nr:hypothetical protein [Methylococcales bacterium]